jgi:hypothetical protein
VYAPSEKAVWERGTAIAMGSQQDREGVNEGTRSSIWTLEMNESRTKEEMDEDQNVLSISRWKCFLYCTI